LANKWVYGYSFINVELLLIREVVHLKKSIFSIGIILTLLFGLTLNVSAYVLQNIGYADSDIDYKSNSNVGSIYLTAMSSAKNHWNNAGCDGTVSSSTVSANYIENFAGSTTVYGRYTALELNNQTTHRATWFKIGLNSDLFPNMTTNAQISVCVHELGHAMSLYDLTSGTAIMNTNRNRNLMYTPQTDDINGVNASW
jgi:hypothetical protein